MSPQNYGTEYSGPPPVPYTNLRSFLPPMQHTSSPSSFDSSNVSPAAEDFVAAEELVQTTHTGPPHTEVSSFDEIAPGQSELYLPSVGPVENGFSTAHEAEPGLQNPVSSGDILVDQPTFSQPLDAIDRPKYPLADAMEQLLNSFNSHSEENELIDDSTSSNGFNPNEGAAEFLKTVTESPSELDAALVSSDVGDDSNNLDKLTDLATDAYYKQNFVTRGFLAKLPGYQHNYMVRAACFHVTTTKLPKPFRVWRGHYKYRQAIFSLFLFQIEKRERERVFGPMKPLSFKERREFLHETGIDLDGEIKNVVLLFCFLACK